MTREEYLIDEIKHPERKYLLVENADGSTNYVPIDRNPYRDQANPYRKLLLEKKRKKEANLRLVDDKGVSKVTRSKDPSTPYVFRLGYNCCTGQYMGDDQVASLSGSSMNRKPAKKRSAGRRDPPADPRHVMSSRSKGKIRDKATAFYRSLRKDRIFVTLTFIQHVDDRTGRQILNKFLTVVRKEIPGFEYLCIAEHQPERKEKTIHFHVLSNKFMTVQRYNNLWVLQQYNSGLIGRSKTCGCKKRCSCEKWGPEITKEEIQSRYKDGTVQQVLNPLDVERAYCISGLSWYLTKYVTKMETGESFGCLTWHCSRRVSRLFTNQVVGPSTFAFLLSFRNWKVDRKTGECWTPKEIKGDFYCLVFVNNKPVVLERLAMLETVNNWIIDKRLPDKLSRDELMYIDWDYYRRSYVGRPDKEPSPPTVSKQTFLYANQKIGSEADV